MRSLWVENCLILDNARWNDRRSVTSHYPRTRNIRKHFYLKCAHKTICASNLNNFSCLYVANWPRKGTRFSTRILQRHIKSWLFCWTFLTQKAMYYLLLLLRNFSRCLKSFDIVPITQRQYFVLISGIIKICFINEMYCSFEELWN